MNRSYIFRAALVAGFLALSVAPVAADCRTDLDATHKSFEDTMKRLESVAKATQAEKCVAYRAHVEVMTKGRGVFMRCMTGHSQRENVGQMNDSLEDFAELIKARCTK